MYRYLGMIQQGAIQGLGKRGDARYIFQLQGLFLVFSPDVVGMVEMQGSNVLLQISLTTPFPVGVWGFSRISYRSRICYQHLAACR